MHFVRCGCSSSGRAPPCQGGGSEFEPRHPLHKDRFRKEAVFLFAHSGSKHQMQHAGGILLAAGRDGGHTIISLPRGK